MPISAPFNELDTRAVNAVRVLAADTVQKAKSGHPGMPMGMAPAAHVLWTRALNCNPANPNWINRDRFVLSNGHGCALQYCMLHLAGYNLSMDDLKSFRQLNSKTPGHPENFLTDGIEVSTGPLGQGLAQAVGMALAAKHMANKFNKPDCKLLDHKIYVFCGDGCLQEGVASEACSLAGHLQLDNLIVVYDDNNITIDGKTSLSFTEDVPARFRAYGWDTLEVADGNQDLASIAQQLDQAKQATRPVIISLKTVIGYGSSKADTRGVHGSPLGDEVLAAYKTSMGHNPDEKFFVPDDVAALYKAAVTDEGAKLEAAWQDTFKQYEAKYPAEAAELMRMANGQLPATWKNDIPTFDGASPKKATRAIGGAILNAIAPNLPELIGGAADLTPSTKTQLKCSGDYQKDTLDGRYIRFGVREFGMFAICNGISAYGMIPFSATFLNFITYGFGAVRLGALSHLQHIYYMTHDSIFLGEDGPTHQPVEVLPALRACPNFTTIRPADGNEVAGAFIYAIERRTGPTCIILSRQGVDPLANSSRDGVNRGMYAVDECKGTPDVILVSTGSEVCLTVQAAQVLREGGANVRVVSAPSLELFDAQDAAYRRSVLPVGVAVVSVEASSPNGWAKYSHMQIAVREFGRSAPLAAVQEFFGFQPSQIAATTKAFLDGLASPESLMRKGQMPVLQCQL